MDVKIGDRVSIDGIKVGQARRTGVVQNITEGLSGIRYLVRWDDGHETFFSPSGGNLIVEAGRRGTAKAGNARNTPAKKAGTRSPTGKK